MANTIQDEIYQDFLKVSRQQGAELALAGQSLADVILQADAVRQDLAQQTARLADPARGGSRSGTASAGSGSQGTSEGPALSTVFDVVKDGLGVSPLIRGILGLFGGGDMPAPAPLMKYTLPPAIQFQAAEAGGRVMSADYDQAGMARGYGAPSSGGVASGAAPQITVNVQAMDSRSFLDRSNDIALAVREAMLNLNAINDVVNDL
jgi:hypothetical protein